MKPPAGIEPVDASVEHAAIAIAQAPAEVVRASLESAEIVADEAPVAAAPEPAPAAATLDDLVESVAVAAAFSDPLPVATGTDAGVTDAPATTATEKAKTMIEQMNDRAKTAMEKSSKMFEDMNEFNKGNVEAIVESSKIAAKALETMGQEAADYSRRSVETMTTAFKSFAQVKSPTELFKLQSDYARSAFDAMVAESSKTTEMMLKLAGDVAQPLSSRVAVAAEKIKLAA